METKNLDLFEFASRKKLRFLSSKGLLSVEDLWDLNLDSLNNIAKSINKKIKESGEEDFINKNSKSSEEVSLQISLEIVKHIINVKLDEKNERLAKAEKAERRRKILEALEKAENRDLESKSIDELKKMLDDLD